MGFRSEAPHEHVVQFYDRDHELAAAVSPYLAETIQAGGVAIVIATEAHRQAFAARLVDAGVDPDLSGGDLTPAGAALVMRDAREAADALLIDGRIAADRFDRLIGDLVREAASGGRSVRAYGEIVAVLWADGHVRAALELEELWNGLGRELDFFLYCAYPLDLVEGDSDVEALHAVCRQHSAVVESVLDLPRLEARTQGREASFDWSGRGPADARRFVRETLADWACPGLIDDAALIVTELATNAILHARSGFTVGIFRRPDGTVRVAVSDASLGRPRPRRALPSEHGGRGLYLVEVLATAWGTDLLPGGKVVWAELGPKSFAGRLRAAAPVTAN
jgi:hypothetical protein